MLVNTNISLFSFVRSEKMYIKLQDLSPGEKGEIIGYEKSEAAYRERILSMGLTRGTQITLKKIAPLGDPVEVSVGDCNISLRKAEAAILKLRRVS
jgi:ferrous iron transport protein A